MLRGLNELTLDAKGRLAIPTRYRQELTDSCGGQLVVTVDRDHCLLVYPFPEWEIVEKKIVKLPALNSRVRQLQRLLVGHATEVEMDGSGRVLVPPPLRDYAALDKKVVLLGQGNKFELWDAQRWQDRRQEWLEGGEEEGSLPEELESLSL
ncbi:division/cell wall cluster transcriptional repressor MraZ [Kaarinaea lacus]